ncbi:hypothetical protein EK21DRAFT_113891 [Setomelanomma holmii]|uniref:Tetratricopeptide repeat protein n=1 Tax=Setomelanomma holmii TaxID=210430 RepID=A0A9P4LKN2_9PLEO|nr:hypothetical protein EK21DRAFT_113891 [Setomelanomma holmii]
MDIHITYHFGLCYRAPGKLDLAAETFKTAAEETRAHNMSKSLLHALCLYKQGCIEFQAGRVVEARSFFQDSLDIREVLKTADCERVRAMHGLARVLDQVAVTDEEKMKQVELFSKAQAIRKNLQGDEYTPEGHIEEAYDGLVDGQFR